MKSRVLLFALLPSVALAQPAPAPTPTPPDQPQNPPAADSPQWLPGVVDVTAAETAVPGKLTLTMARAVEIAQKTQPSLRQSRASVEAAQGRVDSARVAEHPTVSLAGTVSASSDPRGPCVGRRRSHARGDARGREGVETGFIRDDSSSSGL